MRHGAKVSSGATDDLEQQRLVAARQARQHLVEHLQQLAVLARRVRAGQPNARARPATSTPKPGHGARAAVLLGEPVHDRVAAVREDHEERAGAVVRGAPERLDRSTATSRRRRSRRPGRSGSAMRSPIAAGRAKPSPPIAGLSEPSDSRAGRRASSSGRFDGDSSITIASRGRRSAIAAKTCPARSGSPAAGGAGAGGARERRGRRARRARARRARARRRPAPGAASTARSAALRCTSAGSRLTIATPRSRPRRTGPGS